MSLDGQDELPVEPSPEVRSTITPTIVIGMQIRSSVTNCAYLVFAAFSTTARRGCPGVDTAHNAHGLRSRLRRLVGRHSSAALGSRDLAALLLPVANSVSLEASGLDGTRWL
jgi:hypothetical protein